MAYSHSLLRELVSSYMPSLGEKKVLPKCPLPISKVWFFHIHHHHCPLQTFTILFNSINFLHTSLSFKLLLISFCFSKFNIFSFYKFHKFFTFLFYFCIFFKSYWFCLQYIFVYFFLLVKDILFDTSHLMSFFSSSSPLNHLVPQRDVSQIVYSINACVTYFHEVMYM